MKRPSVLLGTAHLAALWALAIVQPMLSLLGGSPEFFVARGNTFSQIVLFALVLTFGVPLIALLMEFVFEKISPRLRWAVHLGLMTLVATVLAVGLLERFLDLSTGLLVVIALAIAIAGVFVYDRFRFPRTFMDLLTPAPIVILLLFVFLSPASKVILPGSDPEPIEIEIEKPNPVVMVIFDEFPLATLLESEDRIDASRYPNFAAIASQSNWYRNASAAAAYTPFAVPALLSGQAADLDKVPVATEYPESIFTLLGGTYDLRVDERLTRICPDGLCPASARTAGYDSGTDALFSDLLVVSGHVVLPESMRENLPDISSTFGGFGEGGADDGGYEQAPIADEGVDRAGDGGTAANLANVLGAGNRRSVEEQVAAFTRRFASEDGPSLDMIHLLKPHIPWKHIPNGQRYSNLSDEWMDLSPEFRRWETPQKVVDTALQRGLLEVGFTDTLLGRIKDALEKRGLWDESLVVITADHGAGFLSRDERRRATPTNFGEIASVPLLIKAPGQQTARVVDRHTCLSSVLSRMAGILGIDYPWPVDRCSPEEVRVVGPPNDVTVESVARMERQRNRLLERIEGLFTTGTGWGPVYRSGPRKELIGRSVRSFELVPARKQQFAVPELPRALNDFDPDGKYLRGLLQRGRARGVEKYEVVAIAVNGRIEGVGWTFDDRDRGGLGYSILLDPKVPKRGYNRLDVYLVEDGGKSLRPLFEGPDNTGIQGGS